MVPLKQKETAILFNVFLLESTLPPTTTSTVFKSIEGIYNGTPVFTAFNPGTFLQNTVARASSRTRSVKGPLSSQMEGVRKRK